MRERFDAQLRIGSIPISEIKIPTKSRDEFPPYLRAVQEIYNNSELSAEIFDLVEKAVCKKDSKNGRPGMNLWTIFVLAGARMCLGTDYDRLHYLANSDSLLRKMIGHCDAFVDDDDISLQTIKDNVTLLDDETLKGINDVIVKMGHGLLKKKETDLLLVKTDSYVLESNVHFPTDYNLLWDSSRKSLDMIGKLLLNEPMLEGWRKRNSWRKELKTKSLILSRAQASSAKGKEERVEKATNAYLEVARNLAQKIETFVMETEFNYAKQESILLSLCYFQSMMIKHIDLVHRRLILKEKIPAREKIFSIFETYTEWITKGKMRPTVELGKRVNFTTDQFHLIIDWEISNHTADVDMLLPLVDRLIAKYKIQRLSADKGYFKKEYRDLIAKFIPLVVIPQKGKLSAAEREIESSPIFCNARYGHSAIESNINEAEHRGLDRCKDKGYIGFEKYVGLGVLAYNLKRIGEFLLEKDRQAEKKSA
ncbi:MAG: ISNCY family transposase [Paludibacter sp.]|nr:ISNCY family transposase [Paludibacter sp.]